MASVLITGASSGIGLASALLLARRGQRVFASARTARGVAAVESAARAEGVELDALELDVTRSADCERAVKHVLEVSGGLDVLVNNAGRVMYAAVEETGDDAARELLELNLLGPLRAIRAVLPAMREARSGTIVNVSSVNAIFNLPYSGMYGATKKALEALSETLCQEVAPYGIRVRIVQPSGFQTGIVDSALPSELDGSTGAYTAAVEKLRAASRATNALSPDLAPVAEAVCDAALDDAPELRRPVGMHAVPLSRMRRELDDEALLRALGEMVAGSND